LVLKPGRVIVFICGRRVASPALVASLANDFDQQALIAEGIDHVMAKYGRATVAT
jgi:hypothetical protein